jgi:cysteine desulfurase
MARRTYLDSAAAHPVRASAKRAFFGALKYYGNPASPHEEGRKARAVLEAARSAIAREVGVKPDSVVFTSGATESNALAIVGHVKALVASGASASALRVLYSPMQHASTLGAVKEVELLGVTVLPIPLSKGEVDLKALKELLKDPTCLITLDLVCGETGLRNDTRSVRTLIDALPREARPVFHIDATQAPLVEHIDRMRIGADFISFDAQKIGGVRGCGVLIAPRTTALLPLVMGSGQERGIRSGTPSPALSEALAEALRASARERKKFVARSLRLRTLLKKELERFVPDAVMNEGAEHAPHIVNFSVPGLDAEYMCALLNARGIAVAAKSACESDEPYSRVVYALTEDKARATSALRLSFSHNTSARDILRFVRTFTVARPLATSVHS